MKNETLDNVVELVVYKIKPECVEKYSTEIIDFFRKTVMSLKGFISYEFFQNCKNENLFMDIVYWDTLENAENAAKTVKEIQKGEDFMDYINAFNGVEIFSHFKPLKKW